MGQRLLAALGLVFCLFAISIHAQGNGRGGRNDRFKPRSTEAPSTTEAPTTKAATAVRTGGSAGRKAAAVSSAENRRNQANGARATVRGVPNPIRIVPIPNIPGLSSPTKGDDSVTLPGGEKVSSPNGTFVIFGFKYEICETESGRVLLPSDYYICCDGKYYENANPNSPKECCGQDYYLPDQEICCQGFYYPKYDELTLLETRCCADVYYIPDLEICCGGRYDDKFRFGCCNGNFYGLDTHACCNGIQHPRFDNFQCCDVYYGPSDFICCNGFPYHSFFYQCCENKAPFIGSTQQCCPGDGVRYHGEACH